MKETIGGPKSLARPGDFIIENDMIRVAILGERPSMGNHTEGGSILDADLQRRNPRYSKAKANDRLSEVFASVNLEVARIRHDEGEVKIVSKGGNGQSARICTTGDGRGFITMLDALSGFLGEFRIRTDYILAPGSGAIEIRSYVDPSKTVTCDEPMPASLPVRYQDESIPLIEIIMAGGFATGDFTLFGGAVDVFVPGVGFDEATYVNELTKQGVNTFVDPIVAPYLAGSADGVSYAFMADKGSLSIPVFTGSQTAGFGGYLTGDDLAEGQPFHYVRWLSVGHGDVGTALNGVLAATKRKRGHVQGWIVEKGTGLPLSDVHVFAYKPGADGPWAQWTTDVGDDTSKDGSFGGDLPTGRWDLVVHAPGRPEGVKVPITVRKNKTVQVVLESPQPGSVSFEIMDETGRLLPGKVSFFSADGRDVRRPDLGDGRIGGHPAEVTFAPYGTGHIVLPPGTYYAVASRGTEYEVDISHTFELKRDGHVSLDFGLIHSVDTSGWISADFHVHAMPSPDSGVSLEDRVATFVSEGVEFLASSDHDAITDYAPVIGAMDLQRWLSSTPGIEVTTIELGHFLGFPLLWDPMADAGGALDWTDLEPSEILDGIVDLGAPGLGEPVVFVAHPRDGLLGYFDQYGLDPFDGTPNNPKVDPGFLQAGLNELISTEQFTLNLDAMEVLNAKRFEMIRTPTEAELRRAIENPASLTTYDILSRTMEEQQALMDGVYTLGDGMIGPLDDWFTLLNLGYRITALGNSDTHSKTTTEAGCPRNFVQSPTDDPALLDAGSIADAVKEGRVVASYGPFIRFSVNEWANGPGTTVIDNDRISLYIEVQSPGWFDVDRVELYENGTLIHEWEINTPNDDVVNLATEVQHTPEKDSWYVVVALGDDDMSPVFTPVDLMPIQLQDIVEGALGEIDIGFDLSGLVGGGAPVPRTFPIHPFAVTNPVFVDKAGDGFDAPGIPEWLVHPTPLEEE
jgi:hypothetical protein